MACLKGLKMLDWWPDHVLVAIETGCSNVIAKAQSNDRDFSVTSAIIGNIKNSYKDGGLPSPKSLEGTEPNYP
jgi:hypothetical protein